MNWKNKEDIEEFYQLGRLYWQALYERSLLKNHHCLMLKIENPDLCLPLFVPTVPTFVLTVPTFSS